MSSSVAVYLGVAALSWGPCVFFARRFVSGGRLDRLIGGALFAMGWPVSLPLLIAAYVVDRRRPVRRTFPVAAAPPAVTTAEAVVATR